MSPTTQYFLNRLALIFLALVLIYGFAHFFGPLPLTIRNTTTNADLFTVTGTGEEKAVPKSAEFTVGVTKTGSSVDTAKNQVNQVTNKITSDLKNLGVEEKNIKTVNFSSNPSFGPNGQQTGEFTVSQDIQVKVDSVDLANQALDTATADGANQINGVSFTLDDADKKSVEEKARKEAIKDAKQKAQELAKDAGIHLGKIVNVQVNDGGQPIVFDAKRADAGTSESVPTDLQPGENSTQVSVTLSYETY